MFQLRSNFYGFCVALLFVMLALSSPAQTVALGHFAHTDYERNEPLVTGAILDQLVVGLDKKTGFSFVERAEMDRLIAEQVLTREDFSSADGAARLGRLLRADLLLCGTFYSPAGRPASVMLEVIEPSRAEAVARAVVELGPVLQRGSLTPLSENNVQSICRVAAPLLAEGWREVEHRSSHILIKLLALPNSTENPRWNRLGERLENALLLQARKTSAQKILLTHRTEMATEESELRVLGLVESDDNAWNDLADYYLLGSCETAAEGPVLKINLWDGRTKLKTFTYPLSSDPDQLEGAMEAVAADLLSKTTTATRINRKDAAKDQRISLAGLLLKQSKAVGIPALDLISVSKSNLQLLEEPKRLASAAVFLDTSNYDAWAYLALLRDRECMLYTGSERLLKRAAALEFKFSLTSRFLVGPGGTIRPGAIEGIPAIEQSPFAVMAREIGHTGHNYADIHQGRNLLGLRERLRARLQVELDKASLLLASVPPGNEAAYGVAAETILAHAFDTGLPAPFTARLVERLWPRLKVARVARQAWYPMGDHVRGIEDRIRDLYLDQGRFDAVRLLENLTAKELQLALSAPPPPESPGGEALGRVQAAGKAPSARLRQLAEGGQEKYEACRLQAEVYLRARTAPMPDVTDAVSRLVQGPISNELKTFHPPIEEYPLFIRGKLAAALHASCDKAEKGGYPPVYIKVMRAQITAWANGMPDYVKNTRQDPSIFSRPPFYLDPERGSSLLSTAAREGDFASVAKILNRGVLIEGAGRAFVVAVENRNWALVEYLFKRGYNPAAPWPIVEIHFNQEETPGALALAEAMRAGRVELVDRLLAAGVRFRSDRSLFTTTLEQVVRQGDASVLGKILATHRLPPATKQMQDANYLAAAVERRNLEMLNLLLAAGAPPHRYAGKGYMQANLDGELFAAPDHIKEADYEPGYENPLTMAARSNWREGVAAMLAAPAFDSTETFQRWPYRYATDPATRALLLRAILEAVAKGGPAQASGIDLAVAIAGDDMPAALAAWKDPAARSFRPRFGLSPMAFAIMENRPAIARQLVEQGAPLDDFDTAGITPLGRAAALGDVELVRFLAAKGAGLNLQRGSAPGPLGCAIYSRKEACALALMDLGATMKASTQRAEDDPLFVATLLDLPVVVERLLAMGANPRAVYAGQSMLFAASRSNNPELIQRFVDLGCNPLHRNLEGRTLLVTAVRWGASAATAKLLALGLRDPVAGDVAVDISKDMWSKWRPSEAALRAQPYRPDYRGCLELMDESGLIASSPAARNRIFWDEASRKTEEQINAFLKTGGDVNFRGGHTPLQFAALYGHTALVKLLLAKGANPEAVGLTEREVPLSLALNHPEIVRMLLESHARTDVWTGYQKPVLAAAVSIQQVPPATVRLLLDHGAVIDDEARKAFSELSKEAPARITLLVAALTPRQLAQLQSAF